MLKIIRAVESMNHLCCFACILKYEIYTNCTKCRSTNIFNKIIQIYESGEYHLYCFACTFRYVIPKIFSSNMWIRRASQIISHLTNVDHKYFTKSTSKIVSPNQASIISHLSVVLPARPFTTLLELLSSSYQVRQYLIVNICQYLWEFVSIC